MCDDLLSFVVHSRSSFSCATRHFAQTMPSMPYRRQTVIALGLAFLSVLDIPAMIFVCPKCELDPETVIMDGQSVGFEVPENWDVLRCFVNIPVLPIPLSGMTVFTAAAETRLIQRITRNATALAASEVASGVALLKRAAAAPLHPVQEAAVVILAFFFPMDETCATILRRRPSPDVLQAPSGMQLSQGQRQELARHLADVSGDTSNAVDETGDEEDALQVGNDDVGGGDSDEDANGSDMEADDGSDRDGGSDDNGPADSAAPDGKPAVPPTVDQGGRAAPKSAAVRPWHSRTGAFSPCFEIIPKDNTTAWTSIRWFVRALFGEPVVNMLVSCDGENIAQLVKALRDDDPMACKEKLGAVSEVAFVARFLSRVAYVLDAFPSIRFALAHVLEYCGQVELDLDKTFDSAAEKLSRAGKGAYMEYCDMWKISTPEKFVAYVKSRPGMDPLISNDALATLEVFPMLKRVRPAIWDNTAATRRTAYAAGQKKKRSSMSAAKEDISDNCNKNFPTDRKLTPGVYNLLCPHVVCYGFRVLTKAESVEDGISVVLERFAKIPKTIYYEMACKMNRNFMRRVRPLFRHHGVRCFMDRPHGKGHTCSLVNFADAPLRHTLGKASTAAETSHSIAIRI